MPRFCIAWSAYGEKEIVAETKEEAKGIFYMNIDKHIVDSYEDVSVNEVIKEE